MQKKLICTLLAASFCCLIITAATVQAKGGAGPLLASCCLGPRIGLEMNGDVEIEFLEFLRLAPAIGDIVHIYVSYDYGYKAAGFKGFLASCCLGPRIGKEFNERKIRTKEWLRLVPIVKLYAWAAVSMEAYGGKTMTEIAEEENLNR